MLKVVDDENQQNNETRLSRYISLLRIFGVPYNKTMTDNCCDAAMEPAAVSVSEVMREMKSYSASCPTRVHRVMDWNGKLKAFEERRFSVVDQKGAMFKEAHRRGLFFLFCVHFRKSSVGGVPQSDSGGSGVRQESGAAILPIRFDRMDGGALCVQ